MKRSWIGAGILALLLAGALTATRAMVSLHEPVARDLITAGEYALAGSWEEALRLSRQAEEGWEDAEVLRACFADHGPAEQIDACFAQLEVYSRLRETAAFAAACGDAARKVAAIGEAHKLIGRNFF